MATYLLISTLVGLIGLSIIIKHNKFAFADRGLTAFAFIVSLIGMYYGGPVLFLLALLLPAKQICIYCTTPMPATASSCPHCGRAVPSVITPEIIEQAQEIRSATSAESESLWKRNPKLDKLVMPVVLVYTLLLIFVLRFLLAWISELRFSFLQPYVHIMYPLDILWWLPAMFMGLAISGYTHEWVYWVLLKGSHQEYIQYQKSLPHGVTSENVARIFFAVVGLLCAIGVLLLLDWYIVVYPDAVAFDSLWGLQEKRYTYAEVTSIYTSNQARNNKGEIVDWKRSLYLIEFADGQTWDSKGETSERPHEEIYGIVGYVSQQSGLPIQIVQVLPENAR